MLHEKHVSAFSAWEKELHKIVFDPRYLLLDNKERRQVFDQYVRARAEEERKEMKNRLQQKQAAYKQLMEEAKLHSNEFSAKHGKDERFKAIEKSRDRTAYFNEYIAEVRRKEKEEKERKRDQVSGRGKRGAGRGQRGEGSSVAVTVTVIVTVTVTGPPGKGVGARAAAAPRTLYAHAVQFRNGANWVVDNFCVPRRQRDRRRGHAATALYLFKVVTKLVHCLTWDGTDESSPP
ncbi:hypothetical protein ACJJTC_010801 [Scirpophaga incertulas]